MPAREGSLEAPIRHPIDWRNPEFYDETSLLQELEPGRVGQHRAIKLIQQLSKE